MSLRPCAVNFDSTWKHLGQVVLSIIKCEPVSREVWNSSFGDVYSLCVAKPDSLAENLYKATSNLIDCRVKEIVVELSAVHLDQLLPEYTHHWEVFHKGILYLHNLFSYVNIQYVKNRRPMDSDMCYGDVMLSILDHNMEIQELGMDFWRMSLWQFQERLMMCLMREIRNDRKDLDGQQRFLSPVIESLIIMEEHRPKQKQKSLEPLYKKCFLDPLMEETKNYYFQWAAQKVAELSCAEYLQEALELRTRECTRAEKYYKTSKTEIFDLFQKIVVVERREFLNQHVKKMVKEERKDDLRNMYELLAANNLCDEILKHFLENVKNAVSMAMQSIAPDANAPLEFVEQLISIRKRFCLFIEEVFNNENAFRSSMDKAFSLAVNEKHGFDRVEAVTPDVKGRLARPAELLCKYADTVMRKSPKSLTEGEVDDKLSNVIVLFKYIDDKDLFQKYYQRMLCKRLIFSLASSMDAEESMINRLKQVCGYEFTSKFHRMFTDIQLATELNHKFHAFLEKDKIQIKFGFSFMVLTNCSWPLSPNNVEFSVPSELHTCLTEFERFYNSHYHGRKLRWVHPQSTVEMRLCFARKPYLATMSTIQSAVLLHLDSLDQDTVSVGELESGIQPSVDLDMARVLTSLVDSKILIAKDDSLYMLNRDYSNKRLKFKVNVVPQAKEANMETEQVERQVTDDRKFFIQAVIVRIMKSRKQLRHNMLVKEVIDQSKARFLPPVPMIKRCIENLIDKGYMERTPNTTDEYSYLA